MHISHRIRSFVVVVGVAIGLGSLGACSAEEKVTSADGGFDGTCVNCHTGLSAGHVHPGYKLRCIDCHGGNDQAQVPEDAAKSPAVYRDKALIATAHVRVRPELAKFFWANGVDDDNDGKVDEGPTFQDLGGGNQRVTDAGEIFEPGLHGEGAGEFIDVELSRDLNYVRFMNPGDLRVATIGCGGKNRAALDGGGGGGCHQNTVDSVRRSIMVNQPAVINGAYYGNQSWRAAFQMARDNPKVAKDPREGAFGYALDYEGADACIDVTAIADGKGGRGQPKFDSTCAQARATSKDPKIAANAPNNNGLPAFELAQGKLSALAGLAENQTMLNIGAGSTRYPWGGQTIKDTGAVLPDLDPVPDDEIIPGVPDPIDVTLRTFRAYYPLNYPGSTNNFNFTFGTSIKPEVTRFSTGNAFGRGHSTGCTGCHAIYNYDGARNPTPVRNEDGTIENVVDPTTKHREWNASQDIAKVDGVDRLVGRAVSAQERLDTGRADQQRTYSANHQLTTRIDSDQCGLCHGFVTRINLAYQGMAEDEQRNQFARRGAIEWKTPDGTDARILDSWVREDKSSGQPVIIRPEEGLAVIEKAKARDAELAGKGLLPGAGGCAAATFTEDCNNNGELDRSLVLTRRDESGSVVAEATINEDANGNGMLDLVDHAPREKSIDGRQMSYVYGGRNGSTKQMDVHFERGMHCIDCHMLQDVHGDGHLYSTNWDHIEIECEDCHGATDRSNLRTSGPNGGNDLTGPKDPDGKPYFERKGDAIIQRSRVTPGVFWRVPQTQAASSAAAKEAHAAQHVAAPGAGSTFAGEQGSSALVSAKLECQTCHSSWVHNCMGCHADLNLGDPIRKTVATNGNITKTAGENETWLSNTKSTGHINFQLLGFMRSPYVLGVDSKSDHGRLAPFRSSMQLHVNVTDGGGHTLLDNTTFTTFQAKDGNSGRSQVATSAVAMNQTMPHTTRPREVKGCETCHTLVDQQQRVRNEHVLGQTYGIGVGEYPFIGDWAIVAGTGGIELYEHKQERELAANVPGASNRFPGFVVSGGDRTQAKVEPIFDAAGSGLGAAAVANDVVLLRNFNAVPAPGQTEAPTLRDFALVAVAQGATGSLLMADLSGRGHPTSVRQSVSTAARNFRLAIPGVPKAIAHISPDTSDPFVYVASGTAGVTVVEIENAPGDGTPLRLLTTVALGGKDATEIVLAGDVAYVGTAEGTIEVLDLNDPAAPRVVTSVQAGGAVRGLAVSGMILYGATSTGLMGLGIQSPLAPANLAGASAATILAGVPANELSVYGSTLFLAAGNGGVLEIDVALPAQPKNNGNIASALAPGQPINAVDVAVSRMPGQTWVLVVDTTGDLYGLKLDQRKTIREKCFPDPRAAGCLLNLDFLDPTINQRDPSFDPVAGTFDGVAADPSAVTFVKLTSGIVTTGRRLARPAIWEQLGTLTGRRLRDSFMPGSGSLSLPVMQRMRGVVLCENPATKANWQSGLGALGYADGGFFANGQCTEFQPTMQRKTVASCGAPASILDKPSMLSGQGCIPIAMK